MVRQTFIETVGHYSADRDLAVSCWNEIEKAYSTKGRYYHNLNHLSFLLKELSEIKDFVADGDVLVFATVYHDLVYNPLKKNNEEKSAAIASRRLHVIGCTPDKIKLCTEAIRATRHHSDSVVQDINFFTDADLAILGQNEQTYQEYIQNIRKEYSIYPDMLYRPGRKKVLSHFLAMKKIFKTGHFFNMYEKNARKNLQSELSQLK